MVIFVEPTLIPGNVQAIRSTKDPTVIMVTWQPLTLVEARGFIEYLVVLPSPGSAKRQLLSIQVSMDQNSVMFTGLDPSLSYEVSMATVTSNGTVGKSELLIDDCKFKFTNCLHSYMSLQRQS